MSFDRRWLIADLPAWGARLAETMFSGEPGGGHGVALLVMEHRERAFHRRVALHLATRSVSALVIRPAHGSGRYRRAS